MKPSHLAQLRDLSACHMTRGQTTMVKILLAQSPTFRICKHIEARIRRLWNRYQPQIIERRKRQRRNKC